MKNLTDAQEMSNKIKKFEAPSKKDLNIKNGKSKKKYK